MAAVPNSPTTPTRTSTLGKKDKGGWMGTLTKKRQQSKKEGIFNYARLSNIYLI